MLANFFHNTERSIIFFGSCLGSLKFPKKFGEEMVMVLVLIWLFGDHHSQKMDQSQKIGKNSKKSKKLKLKTKFLDENIQTPADFVAKRCVRSQILTKNFFIANGQKLTILSQKGYPPPKMVILGGGGKGYQSRLKERKI